MVRNQKGAKYGSKGDKDKKGKYKGCREWKDGIKTGGRWPQNVKPKQDFFEGTCIGGFFSNSTDKYKS